MPAFWFRLMRSCAAPMLLLLGGQVLAQDGTVEEAAMRSATFKLRPGDQIALHFLREKDLSQTVTVNERGEAAFPKLGTMSVAQLSIAGLQDTLRVRYAEYLRAPELEISVLRRVVVNGEVKLPNVYLVDPTSTLRDVIARAGGITEFGSRAKVAIIRNGQRIPVKEWDAGQILSPLESGDQIFVGRKNWLQINALSAVSTGVLVASFLITMLKR